MRTIDLTQFLTLLTEMGATIREVSIATTAGQVFTLELTTPGTQEKGKSDSTETGPA
jgi:hypothetical protein